MPLFKLEPLLSRCPPGWGRWLLAASPVLAASGLVAADRLNPGPGRTLLLGALLLLLAALPGLLFLTLPRRLPREAGLLEAIFLGSPLPIFGVDREGRVQRHWNRAAQKRFGLSSARALGAPMPVVLPGFQEELRRCLDRVFQGEPIAELQGQGLSEDGPSFPVKLSLMPVFGAGGAVEGALAILGDDAAQKTRLASMVALLGERSALLDGVRTAGIVLWAMDPYSGRLVHVSSAAQELLGASREGLMADAAGLPRLLEPGSRDPFRLAKAEALAGRVGSFEAALDHPVQGRRRWTRWTLDLTGGLIRGVIQDITEARDLREQLLHSQKLETVGEFLSSVSHDFNNILMSILGYNELLLLDPSLSEDQKRRLQVMQRGASRGQALASRLLRFARKGPGARSATDLNDLVAEVMGLLEEATRPSVRFQADLDPDLPTALGDATELHQVIMNLGVNARDAVGQAGEVVFRTRVVDGARAEALGLPATGACILLEVQDTGAGIAQEVRERIFDPFFTTKATGTGLGLAVVNRIVAAHGGAVRCESRAGEGTVFRVLLPVDRTEEGA